jgi:hypothetical protein
MKYKFYSLILILPEPDILQETMIGHYESLGIFSFVSLEAQQQN